MDGKLFTLSNLLMFQLGWFVCVLFGNPWALLYTLFAVLVHLSLSPRRAEDVIAICLCLAIGLMHDVFLMAAGLIAFTETAFWPPLWLTCLWVLLGITLNHSLRWIYQRPLWSGLLGAVSGPLSYLAGVKLSSAEWSSSLTEVIPIMAVLWLIVLPLHRLLSLRIKPYVSH